ncbi:MAG: ABC transporter ATP-binding protein, partial [Candidatus Rokubacteria bacterium]|nr:ABC transporter ATP-binding protein [Candidatus Rokubacteria bacterium]
MGAFLEIDDLEVTYLTAEGSPVRALRAFNLDVSEGEFVSILGVSGCGKSTLLKVAGDILRPTRGAIRIQGQRPEDLRRQGRIGFVFQEATLLPWLTVEKNVAFLRSLTDRPADPARVRDLVRLVGLDGFQTKRPFELSGGMQQRAAIARALALDPYLLLMDEPFGALDEITRDRMAEELLKIWSASRVTVLFVTHSIPEAAFLSDRVVVMTPRPGTIQRVIDVKLPRPRDRKL